MEESAAGRLPGCQSVGPYGHPQSCGLATAPLAGKKSPRQHYHTTRLPRRQRGRRKRVCQDFLAALIHGWVVG